MIEVTNLTKTYGEHVAVDDLSFTVRPGIVTGFLGPNGAGKSTTMRMIVGLDAPTSGKATVGGRPLAQHPLPLASLGSLLEAGAVHPGRSAFDHLRALAVTNGIGTARVEHVLDMVGLGDVARRGSGGFSLGMGQRLGIAAALLADPSVVMLDEPVNGLDPEGTNVSADRLDDLVALLRADGVTIDSTERGAVDVRGRSPEQIGMIARDHGIALTGLVPRRRSLEDVFMELTANTVEYHGHGSTPIAA